MRKRTILAASAILAVGMIAVPTSANAANGGSWLLGRTNSESATTTVSNSAKSPALSLVTPSGVAPLKVNRTTRVDNLNADLLDGVSSGSFLRTTGKAADANLLDGLNSTSFARTSGKTGTIAHDGYWDGMGATCPTGTVFVSGGGYMPECADYIWYSGPDFDYDTGALIPNSWIVIGDYGVGVSNVTCYSPSGKAIPGAATNVSQTTGADDAMLMSASPQDSAPSEAAAAKVAKIKEMRK